MSYGVPHLDKIDEDFPKRYMEICVDSDPADFDSTYGRFGNTPSGKAAWSKIFNADLACFHGADDYVIANALGCAVDDFANWLREGNCPPPRTQKVTSRTKTAASTGSPRKTGRSSRRSGGSRSYAPSVFADKFDRYNASMRQLQMESPYEPVDPHRVITAAVIGGVVGVAGALTFGGAAAVGGGAIATETASTAAVAEEVVKLAAGVLLSLGISSAAEPQDDVF